MDANITLQIDEEVLKSAEKYVRENDGSLSKLFESYLQLVTSEPQKDDDSEFSTRVRRLIGVLDLPPDFDYKRDIADYLWEDYK